MKQLRVNKITEYLEAKKNFEKDYIGIEEQDIDDIDTNTGGPYNIADIRIEQKMITIFQIENWIESGLLNLHPEYHRNCVWNKEQKTALIESILLRMQFSSFCFDEDENGHKSVIDGVERLTTIHEFVQNKFPLGKMQYYPNCNNMLYRELPMLYQSYIMETVLLVNILDARCPQIIKFDIFNRINTCGLKLNPQEIRNAMAKPKVRGLLKEMSSCEEFKTATGYSINDVRMGAQELCLRLLTVLYHYDWEHDRLVNYYGLRHTMDSMISELNLRIEHDYDRILADFKKAMKQSHMILGDDIFNKPGQKRVNASLFTSWTVVLICLNKPYKWIESHAVKIYDSYKMELAKKDDFFYAVTTSTGSRKNILLALKTIRQILGDQS